MTNMAIDDPTPDPERRERLLDFTHFASVHGKAGLSEKMFARILEYAHTCEVPVTDEQLADWFGTSVPLVKGWYKLRHPPTRRARCAFVAFLLTEALLEAETIRCAGKRELRRYPG